MSKGSREREHEVHKRQRGDGAANDEKQEEEWASTVSRGFAVGLPSRSSARWYPPLQLLGTGDLSSKYF